MKPLSNDPREQLDTALSALLALGSASGLEADTLVECLAIGTAYLMARWIIGTPPRCEELDQVLRDYHGKLREAILAIIEDDRSAGGYGPLP